MQITDLVKQGHYQLACGRYFEAKHKCDTKFAPQHPNQYYDESHKLLVDDKEGKCEHAFIYGHWIISVNALSGVFCLQSVFCALYWCTVLSGRILYTAVKIVCVSMCIDGGSNRGGGGVSIVPVSSSKSLSAAVRDANEFNDDDDALLSMCTDNEGDELLTSAAYSDDTVMAMATNDA